nr:hypothetical protein [Acetonema longum]
MRVITGGVPKIPGNTVYEQMKWLEKNGYSTCMFLILATCLLMVIPLAIFGLSPNRNKTRTII